MKYFLFSFAMLFSLNFLLAQDTDLTNMTISVNTTANATGKVLMNNTIVNSNAKLTVISKNGLSMGPGSKITAGSTFSVSVNSAIVDADADGMADSWETLYGLTNPLADADGDGYSNLLEYKFNTNPNSNLSVPPIVLPNAIPVAVPDNISTNENTLVTFNPLLNDIDANNNTLVITNVTGGIKGAFTYTTTSITYTPSLNAKGIDTLTYTISDGFGGLSNAKIYITIGTNANYLISFYANGVIGFISEDTNGYCVDLYFKPGQKIDRVITSFSIIANWSLYLDNVLQVSGVSAIDLNQPVSYILKANDNSISKNMVVRANFPTFQMTSSVLVNGNVNDVITYFVTTNSSFPVAIQVSGLPNGLVFDGVNKISGTVASAVDVTTTVTITSNNQTIKAKILFDFDITNNFTDYQTIWRPDYQITSGAWSTSPLTMDSSIRSVISKNYLNGHNKIRFKLKAAPTVPLIFKGFRLLSQTSGPSGTYIQAVTFGGVDVSVNYLTVPANSEIISDIITLPTLTSDLLYTYHSTTTSAKTYNGTAATQSWISTGGWWEDSWANRSNYGVTNQFIVTEVESIQEGLGSGNIDFGFFQINGVNGTFLDTNSDGIKDLIYLKLPAGTLAQKLKPKFGLNGAGTVLVDEFVQVSDVSIVDFSSIQKYRVQSTLNSSEKIYYVKAMLGFQDDYNFDDINDLVDVINVVSTNMDHDGDTVPNFLESFNKTDPFNIDSDADTFNDFVDGFPNEPSFSQIPAGQGTDVIKPNITVTVPANLTIIP